MVPVRRTVPSAGSASPASTRASVVLPAPFRPTRPILSPGAIWKLAASSSNSAPARSSRPPATITRTHSPRLIRCLVPGSPASRGAASRQHRQRERRHPARVPERIAAAPRHNQPPGPATAASTRASRARPAGVPGGRPLGWQGAAHVLESRGPQGRRGFQGVAPWAGRAAGVRAACRPGWQGRHSSPSDLPQRGMWPPAAPAYGGGSPSARNRGAEARTTTMPDKLMRLWRHDQPEPRRPVMLAIAGDSAAGKTTLTKGIAETLGADRATALCVDDYHRYDRAQRRDVPFTVLHPDCNYIDVMEQHLQLLALGRPILKPVYDHSTGSLVRPVLVE